MNPAEDIIDDRLLRVFTNELLNQWTLANIAAENLNYLLGGEIRMDANIFWYHTENFVKALVAMTNILWTSNSRSRHKRRSRLIRERFGLTEEQAPLDLRETRNWFEHFDEKIDDWWDSSTHKNLADRNIMPKSGVRGLEPEAFARSFDPETYELSVFGRSVNLLTMHSHMSGVVRQIVAVAKTIPTLQHLVERAP